MDDSDNSAIWWIIGISILLGIVFFFDKDIWPQLQQPILRCLVAPFAGVVLLILWFLYTYLISVAAPAIISTVFLWLTAPRLVFPVSLLIAIGTSVGLWFKWMVVPVSAYWAMLDSMATGIVGGFITARLVRTFKPGSSAWQAVVSLLVSVGLTYWIATKLQPTISIGWIITTIIIMIVFVIRFLYEESQKSEKKVEVSPSFMASYLPQDVKAKILQQVREQIGVTQYDKLVSTFGEDEIINQVMKNMQK